MESWPLWVQWGLLLVLGATFLGASWWLALERTRAAGAEPASWSGKVRAVVRSFRFADWAFTALMVAFLVPLAIRTVAGP